jgi:hypothetical protein
MKRIATANRAIDLFGAGKDGFKSAVPGVSDPTYCSPQWFNFLQEAIVRTIEQAGMTPSDDYDQFAKALTIVTTAQATRAEVALVATELARDASFVTGPKYGTEALGRIAVADGVNYLVQGSGDVAAYEYRRTNSTTSMLIAIYPSAASVANIDSRISKISSNDYALVFTDAQLHIAAAILKNGGFAIADLRATSATGGNYSPETLTVGGARLKSDASTDYVVQITDSAGRIAFGIKNTGELVVGKITATEANISGLGSGGSSGPTLDQIGSYFGLLNISPTVAYAIGDSTVAAYAGGTAILDLVISSRTKNSLAVPGQTIAQQKSVWQSATVNPVLVGWVVIQIGLNDLVPSEAASVAIARIQDLVATVRTKIGSSKPILISQMTPCRQRLTDIYGSTNGPISYQKWLDINSAIAGSGSTPITGVEGRITSHVELMNDGTGNLLSTYNTGDNIHPNTAGRQINATAWVNGLQAARIAS